MIKRQQEIRELALLIEINEKLPPEMRGEDFIAHKGPSSRACSAH
jgi:hypothetical protein